MKNSIQYYLLGEWDNGRRMTPLNITKEQFDYIQKNHELPKSMSPLQTSDFNTLDLKTVTTKYFNTINLKD